jgi:hypothetical protein
MATGFCQPHTARVTLEQEDAKVFLQSFHTRADAGLRYTERVRRMAEIQILGNSQCLDQRGQRYA